ncbi:hypothetical protein [Halorubrum sp. SD626R]|uniref:hypothetical protein n=1 Tax=Halorubrum sp. SD626R TaxID=1419722 RepID=UPI000ADA9E20|nr:hypothetical protein [Halorubrum sp. SD626R]TKX80484.1 hypothetical protein EXE53_10015 [Halorubrum sp. SD626R]
MANRRNVLIGLGSLVAGGGALLGTGAFTSVEANRTVSVQTAGDADALLAFEAANDNPYVSIPTDGQIEINLDNTSGNSNATGLNQNAITTFDELVQITNNGTQPVGTLEFEIVDNNGDDQDVLSVVYKGNVQTDTTSGNSEYSSGDVLSSNIGIGDTATFGLQVDLLNSGTTELDSGDDFTLTIRAEAASS